MLPRQHGDELGIHLFLEGIDDVRRHLVKEGESGDLFDILHADAVLPPVVLRDIIPLVLILVSLPVELSRVLSGANPTLAEYTDPGLWWQLWVPLGWFFAEVVTMVTNAKRRALHDFIAGSVVIRTGGVTSVERRGAAAV
jgi:hypothetical protein